MDKRLKCKNCDHHHDWHRTAQEPCVGDMSMCNYFDRPPKLTKAFTLNSVNAMSLVEHGVLSTEEPEDLYILIHYTESYKAQFTKTSSKQLPLHSFVFCSCDRCQCSYCTNGEGQCIESDMVIKQRMKDQHAKMQIEQKWEDASFTERCRMRGWIIALKQFLIETFTCSVPIVY